MRESPTAHCEITATSTTARTAPAAPPKPVATTKQELQLWKTTVFCTSGPPPRKLHDLHNKDVDHFVQQQVNLFGYKDHGDLPLRYDDDDHDELQLRSHITVPLVHTGHDAGHQGLKTTEEHSPRCIATSKKLRD